MKLAILQQAFWTLAARERSSPHVPADIFVGTSEFAAADRIEIYADMFIARQVDCLREDYPKLAALIGDADFYALVENYVQAHPSRHPSLASLGRHLSSFLAEHPGERSDLSALAALEWARCEVFDEQDAQVASTSSLSELANIDPAEFSLTVVSALRLITLDHDVLGLWKKLENGLPASMPRCAPCPIVVWRKGYDVFHVGLDSHEAAALERALAGESLTNVCEAFESEAQPLEAAMRALGSWFSEGFIAAFPSRRSP